MLVYLKAPHTTQIHITMGMEMKSPEGMQISTGSLDGNSDHVAVMTSHEGVDKLFCESRDRGGDYHLVNPMEMLRCTLVDALLHGDCDKAKALLTTYAPLGVLHAADNEGKQPLHVACHCGLEDIACAMLDTGSPLNMADKDGNQPLHIACRTNLPTVALAMLHAKQEVPIHDRNKHGQQPLHIACAKGLAEVVMLMVEMGAKLDAKDQAERQAVHLACKFGHDRLVMTIINAKVRGCGSFPCYGTNTERGESVVTVIDAYGFRNGLTRIFNN